VVGLDNLSPSSSIFCLLPPTVLETCCLSTCLSQDLVTRCSLSLHSFSCVLWSPFCCSYLAGHCDFFYFSVVSFLPNEIGCFPQVLTDQLTYVSDLTLTVNAVFCCCSAPAVLLCWHDIQVASETAAKLVLLTLYNLLHNFSLNITVSSTGCKK